MDIPLNRSKDNDSFFLLAPAGLFHFCLNDLKRAFGCLGAHQKLGQEYGSLLKALSHPVQSRNHLCIDHFQSLFVL